MDEWQRVTASLGAEAGPRIAYIESQLSSLVDEMRDLLSEIESLKMIKTSVRPVMSPDKAFELINDEVSIMVERLQETANQPVEVGCPLPETLHWVMASNGLQSSVISANIEESLIIIGNASIDEAEQRAIEIITRQIGNLKIGAQREMEALEHDVYKPSMQNMRQLREWMQSKSGISVSNKRLVSPKVTQLRPPSPRRASGEKHKVELLNVNALPRLRRVPKDTKNDVLQTDSIGIRHKPVGAHMLLTSSLQSSKEYQ